MTTRSYQMELGTDGPEELTLRLKGRLSLAEAAALWTELNDHIRPITRGQTLNFDMSGVEIVDGGAMALLVQLRSDLHRRGAAAEFLGASPPVQEIIHLYRGDVAVGPRKRRRALGTLAQIGNATIEFFAEIRLVLAFFGLMLISALRVLRRPRTANWRELLPTMERTGADAVPIVVLINFLVGFVMAFQGAVQLKQFGANIFVADLVGLSIARELGPLMTAIIICGRSGAAFAAELGTMTVSEEIDALRTMGFGPMRFLVLPRALALMAVAPLLTLIADVVGMVGGLFVGIASLDLTVVGYFNETQKALTVWDVFSGIIKSVVFALVIALIACQQGLATAGGAEGVGRRTTSAVVATLFALILVDAVFTLFFYAFNL
ncbi:MAG TPA: MlaE family lipid ABC transporter permease subunit [Pseudomonadota bacterium]|nr:MlaE family lipid ABC transporter permease subunit [Pseudomonadota bacterium]